MMHQKKIGIKTNCNICIEEQWWECYSFPVWIIQWNPYNWVGVYKLDYLYNASILLHWICLL